MPADRARITYTPPRKYREVVSQQGRVLLEADHNEGQRISTEEVRQHALDFVGPCGTPDNGYAITPAAGFDFNIRPGTMYVGGLRNTLEQQITYGAQPDWLDTAEPQPWGDGLWRSPDALRGQNVHALLVLREQEITAVEDPALREVALGGPDTAARTRIIQRVVAADTRGTNCQAAAGDMGSFWSERGLLYNPNTAELLSRARLRVTLVTNPPSPSPCDPPSASGYLGADNQLIRLQVTAFDQGTGRGRLLWGYHNASTLFRCRALDPVTVELASRPVSAEFQPRAGQVVQLLLAAANLGEGAFAAALTGHTAKLAAPYAPDTRRVTLPGPMAAVLQTQPGPRPLFLRLWEDEVDFDLNGPVTLAGTGLQVTVSRSGGGALHVGDYWSIAARPLTPNAVYPERYLAAAQPPDGPRMWACPLAVLRPGGTSFQVADCRVPFDNLPELTARRQGACCCLTVRPEQAPQLQRLIDQAVQGAGGAKVSVHLESGVYSLRRPIVLDKQHKGLLIEACNHGLAVLRASSPDNPEFSYGLIQAAGVSDVTIRGLQFEMSAHPLPPEVGEPMEAAVKSDVPRMEWVPRAAGIAVRALQCDTLLVESCNFRLPSQPAVYAAGIFIQGDNGLIEARRCEFAGRTEDPNSIQHGIALAPVMLPDGPRLVPSSVEALRIEDCLFALLTVGVLLSSRPLHVWASGNIARGVHSAFMLFWYENKVGRPAHFFEHLRKVRTVQILQAADWIDTSPQTLRSLGILLVWPLGALKGRVVLGEKERVYTLGGFPTDQVGNSPRALPRGLQLTMESNQWEALPLNPFEQSGMAVAVWDLTSGAAFANLEGNTARNFSFAPTALVARAEGFNVTGNVFANELQQTATAVGGSGSAGLLVEPGDPRGGPAGVLVNMFTVTGNTIFGPTNLADLPRAEWAKRLPPELGALATWEFFNSLG